MSKKILFTETYFECGAGGVSVPKFQAGSRYPVDAETLRHVTLGRAVEVDAEEEPAPAPAPTQAAPRQRRTA